MLASRTVLLVIFAATPILSTANGFVYAALYACDPVRFTSTFVVACSSNHPRMAAQLDSAFEAWKFRNDLASQKSAKSCVAEMRRRATSEDQFREMTALMKRTEIESDDASKKLAESAEWCAQILEGLQTGRLDVDSALK